MYGRRGVIFLLFLFLVGGPFAVAANAAPTPRPSVTAGQVVKFYVVKAAAENGKPEFLFEIAKKTLGDGDRAPEIFALTKGRLQPDGGRLTDPAAIRPGWVLILPDDAKGRGVQTGTVPGEPKRPAPAVSKKSVFGLTIPVVAGALAGFGLLIAITAVVLIRRSSRADDDAETERPRRRDHEPKRRRRRRLEFDEEPDDETAFASIAASLREETAVPMVEGLVMPEGASGFAYPGVRSEGGAPEGGPGFGYPGVRPDGEAPEGAPGLAYPGVRSEEGAPEDGPGLAYPGVRLEGGAPEDGPGFRYPGVRSEGGAPGGGPGLAYPGVRPGGGAASLGPGGGAAEAPPEPPGVEPYRSTRPDIVVRDVGPGHGSVTDMRAEPGGPIYPGPAGGEAAYRVAFGDDLVTVRLLRNGRSEATAWRPLPHDVPAGMAVVCVGAAPEGCLFLDLGAAPGTVTVDGPADAVERLAEAFVFQLAGDTSRATVAIVGSALETVTEGPGVRRVPNLGALALGQNQSDLVIAVLPSGRDTPEPASPHGPRVVHLKLGNIQDASWTLTVAPDRASLAWDSPANAAGPWKPGP
jgi:hypothetical protein